MDSMFQQPSAMMRFVRRFWVLAALSLAPAVATSFARFAYALLLPAMRSELDLNYSQAGSLSTANAIGYLIGGLVCAQCVPRFGNRRLFSFGLIVTALALAGSGFAEGYVGQLVLRAVAGASSAMIFISGAVLASSLFPDRPEQASSAIAVYFGGAGAGIVLTGLGIPWLLETMGDSAWRTAWLAIGGVSVLFGIASIRAAHRIEEPSSAGSAQPWSISAFQGALASYFLFGAGYIAYMTFVIAWMVSRGASALEVALMWGTLGASTMIAPLVWRVPRSRWPAAKRLAAVNAAVSVGAAIPLMSTAPSAMVLSAFFFGLGMFSAPATVTELVKASLPKPSWGSAVAVFTMVVAVGQAIGPMLSGWIADAAHSLDACLAASVMILLSASGAAICQRQVGAERMPPAKSVRSYAPSGGSR
jgi:predicted MFS family arabinose efflux permease